MDEPLSRDIRVRTNALLAAAIVDVGRSMFASAEAYRTPTSTEDILEEAKMFERFIRHGEGAE